MMLVDAGLGGPAGHLLQDQRVHHLLPLAGRDGAPLVAGARARTASWRHKLAINGFGLVLTSSILISLTLVKFFEGGWATLAGDRGPRRRGLRDQAPLHRGRGAAQAPRRDRRGRARWRRRLAPAERPPLADPKARTAVILVNGFNGLGLHTLLNVPRMFGDTFRNFVFVAGRAPWTRATSRARRRSRRCGRTPRPRPQRYVAVRAGRAATAPRPSPRSATTSRARS